jgi:hypothetical protein
MLQIMPPKHIVVEVSIIISVEIEHKCSSFLYIEHVAQHDQNTPFQQEVFLSSVISMMVLLSTNGEISTVQIFLFAINYCSQLML